MRPAGIDHYAVIIDGGTPMLCSEAGCNLEGLAVGEHTVEVKAYDVAGNVATDSVTITVDTSPFSPSSSSGMMIWIGLAVGAAAIVLIGAVLYLGRKIDRSRPACLAHSNAAISRPALWTPRNPALGSSTLVPMFSKTAFVNKFGVAWGTALPTCP